MKYMLIYGLALYLIGWSVDHMIEDARRKAWTSGFTRGAKSVEPWPTTGT